MGRDIKDIQKQLKQQKDKFRDEQIQEKMATLVESSRNRLEQPRFFDSVPTTDLLNNESRQFKKKP